MNEQQISMMHEEASLETRAEMLKDLGSFGLALVAIQKEVQAHED